MGNNLKYPVLSSLVALNFIMGKGFGVRILAFETLSWSDTILWSMLAAGNSYREKNNGWKLHFCIQKINTFIKIFQKSTRKTLLIWWLHMNQKLYNSIQKLHNSVQILPNSIQKLFTKWKYPHISVLYLISFAYMNLLFIFFN